MWAMIILVGMTGLSGSSSSVIDGYSSKETCEQAAAFLVEETPVWRAYCVEVK